MGDHIRKVRLDRKLQLQEVASIIGVTPDTISNWEQGRTKPKAYCWPGIIRFIGYDPLDDVKTDLSSQLLKYRRHFGLSRMKLADEIGVDESTVYWWERGRKVKPREENTLRYILSKGH